MMTTPPLVTRAELVRESERHKSGCYEAHGAAALPEEPS